MPTYFSDAAYGTPKYVIFADWSAGVSKASCERRLISTFGSCDQDYLDSTWAALDEEFGPEGSMPLYPKRVNVLPEPEVGTMERDRLDAYRRWKGDIGRGALARQIIQEIRSAA